MSFAPAWTIQKKRDGLRLPPEEIAAFIQGITSGEVADYQASAFCMATYFKGMDLDETVALTRAMVESGDYYDLSKIPGKKVDKHSTGGVGDKVSLILAPLAAACGLRVPMMSGRGLGHSGGTLDKLESISGFDVHVSRKRFEELLQTVGVGMIGQSEKIAPADKKLYSLRDVTATVECVPLITASILSKKIAEGTEALVLDVKVGSGAFMKSREQARKLARTLVTVAKKMGLPCRALLTNMDQPLGYAVGNALEVKESIEVLRNHKAPVDLSSADLRELTIQLCAHMLDVTHTVKNLAEGRRLALARLADGSAWKVFEKMVAEQGGSLEEVRNPKKLPHAPRVIAWKSPEKGYISKMETEELGKILVELGGGRKKASDKVDPSVGLIFHKKLGAKVSTGDTLVTVHASAHTGAAEISALEERFHQAITIAGARKAVPKLVIEQIG